MKSKSLNSALLVLTALIWGTAFVAQSKGGDALGAYSFNCLRSFIGGFALIPVIAVLDRTGFCKKPENRCERKKLLFGGAACGAGFACCFPRWGCICSA